MSENSQTLICEQDGQFWIFTNINAEKWNEEDYVTLSKKKAKGVFDNREDALIVAGKLDEEESQFGEGSEYGIVFNHLSKDNTPIKLTE